MRPPFLAPLAKKPEGRLNPNLEKLFRPAQEVVDYNPTQGFFNQALQAQTTNYTTSIGPPSVSYTANVLRNT